MQVPRDWIFSLNSDESQHLVHFHGLDSRLRPKGGGRLLGECYIKFVNSCRLLACHGRPHIIAKVF